MVLAAPTASFNLVSLPSSTPVQHNVLSCRTPAACPVALRSVSSSAASSQAGRHQWSLRAVEESSAVEEVKAEGEVVAEEEVEYVGNDELVMYFKVIE